MTSVSPTCSPLRSCSRNSIAVCAASMPAGAGAAAGGRGEGRRGGSCPQLPSGELEEDVLEAAPLDGQVLGQHAAARAPRGQRGEQLRVTSPLTR